MSHATKEEQLEQSIQFLASEMREVKKKVEIHIHNIEQLKRAIISINEWQAADTKHDVAKRKIEEIRCQRDEIIDEELKVIKNRLSTIESKTIPLPFQFERDLAAEVDELKLRVNEIQAKSHRKFGPQDIGPPSSG
jgi:predicted ribosome quality control (RQC) complex YloA/Tae2 family protein